MPKLTIALLFSYEPIQQLERCVRSLQHDVEKLGEVFQSVEWLLITTPKAVGKDVSFFPGSALRSSSENLAINRNLALAHCQSEALYFIDPDCWLEPGTLFRHCRAFQKHREDLSVYAFAGPNVLRSENENLEMFLQWLGRSRWLHGGLSQIESGSGQKWDWHSPTCNILYDLTKMEGFRFSEKFKNVGEDLEFHFRIHNGSGRKVLIEGEAFVWHEQPPLFHQYLWKVFRYGLAQTHLLKAHWNGFRNRRLLIFFASLVWLVALSLLPAPLRLVFIATSVFAAVFVIVCEIFFYQGRKRPIFFFGAFILLIATYWLGQVFGLLIPMSNTEHA